ncbi:MAG TPA: flagellar hook capping FlgD N-terminal domain-containing protein [Mobilitalea sp.]|nr:flagellar hook capping FlgD N-terminal domain-containing protein [Mobilitalea sp.]
MSDLVQTVKDGVIQQTKSSTTTKKTTNNELGKDAFLQLLTTQMKYQDPLNPNTDTEYISQLATFSQLEQLQNLSSSASTSQAFSLVGKNVIVKAENTTGDTTYISGRVDFVNMNGSKAQLSINGSLYGIDQLDSVIDDTYLTEKGLPGVTNATALKYDAANPKDLTFDVNLGSGNTVADKVAIAINDKIVDSSLVSVSGNKVTVKASAFSGYDNGTYKVTVAFNDSQYTTIKDKVTLQVQNAVIDDTSSDSTAEVTTASDSTVADTTASGTTTA